jgi:three-Cys-motif partner protein
MSTESFFDDQREQSLVKSSIVSKYFWAWAKVISSVRDRYQTQDKRIAYIDLFAGPGRYEDNTKSTPLLVLEKAITDPKMAERLITFFNDRSPNNAPRRSFDRQVSPSAPARSARVVAAESLPGAKPKGPRRSPTPPRSRPKVSIAA